MESINLVYEVITKQLNSLIETSEFFLKNVLKEVHKDNKEFILSIDILAEVVEEIPTTIIDYNNNIYHILGFKLDNNNNKLILLVTPKYYYTNMQVIELQTYQYDKVELIKVFQFINNIREYQIKKGGL